MAHHSGNQRDHHSLRLPHKKQQILPYDNGMMSPSSPLIIPSTITTTTTTTTSHSTPHTHKSSHPINIRSSLQRRTNSSSSFELSSPPTPPYLGDEEDDEDQMMERFHNSEPFSVGSLPSSRRERRLLAMRDGPLLMSSSLSTNKKAASHIGASKKGVGGMMAKSVPYDFLRAPFLSSRSNSHEMLSRLPPIDLPESVSGSIDTEPSYGSLRENRFYSGSEQNKRSHHPHGNEHPPDHLILPCEVHRGYSKEGRNDENFLVKNDKNAFSSYGSLPSYSSTNAGGGGGGRRTNNDRISSSFRPADSLVVGHDKNKNSNDDNVVAIADRIEQGLSLLSSSSRGGTNNSNVGSLSAQLDKMEKHSSSPSGIASALHRADIDVAQQTKWSLESPSKNVSNNKSLVPDNGNGKPFHVNNNNKDVENDHGCSSINDNDYAKEQQSPSSLTGFDILREGSFNLSSSFIEKTTITNIPQSLHSQQPKMQLPLQKTKAAAGTTTTNGSHNGTSFISNNNDKKNKKNVFDHVDGEHRLQGEKIHKNGMLQMVLPNEEHQHHGAVIQNDEYNHRDKVSGWKNDDDDYDDDNPNPDTYASFHLDLDE